MIETIETSSPKVLGMKVCGKLHDEDYKQFVPNVEALLTAKGKLRLLVQFEDFHGWDLHAAWDDLKFGLRHYSDFERIAMVGDRKWEKWMANFCKPFTKAKVKYFEGTPIPTSVVLTGILAIAAWQGRLDDDIYGGIRMLGPWALHPLVLLFGLSGSLMISKTLRIPKL